MTPKDREVQDKIDGVVAGATRYGYFLRGVDFICQALADANIFEKFPVEICQKSRKSIIVKYLDYFALISFRFGSPDKEIGFHGVFDVFLSGSAESSPDFSYSFNASQICESEFWAEDHRVICGMYVEDTGKVLLADILYNLFQIRGLL